MQLTDVQRIVDGLPFMKLEQAERITSLMLANGSTDVIELGFFHGVSTCYMAAALDGTGKEWSIVAIDKESALTLKPNVDELLSQFGLRDRVTLFYEKTSYTWRLMKMLEEDPTPRFDFCYLDGAHNWADDGFAFFLVDRLLKPGAWIVFDDIEWSYATSPSMRDTDFVKSMPEEEQTIQQIRKVFDLLVKTHPNYGEFLVADGWGFAQKLVTSSSGPVSIRREIVLQEVGMGAILRQAYRKGKRAFRTVFPTI
jgi:predicted O-methyltransferase YrrM